MGNETRKRIYRHKVECSICKSQIQSDYTKIHSNRYHKGLRVTYTAVIDSKQKRICFTNIVNAGGSNSVNLKSNNNLVNNNTLCSAEKDLSESASKSDSDLIVGTEDLVTNREEHHAADSSLFTNNNEFQSSEIPKLHAISLPNEAVIYPEDCLEIPLPEETHRNLSLPRETHRNLSLTEETHRNLSLPCETHRNLSHPCETHRNLSFPQETHRNLSLPKESPYSSLFTNNNEFAMETPVTGDSSDIVTIEDSNDKGTTDSLPAPSTESENEDSVASSSNVENNFQPKMIDESCPNQPKLDSYNPQTYGKRTRDFNYEWFKKHPWLSYDEVKKEASCFSCSKFLPDSSFVFTNWKKPEKLLKHGKSQNHCLSMLKWIDARRTERNKTTVASLMISEHAKTVEENRKHMRVIIETLMFTAVQNIALRGATESRQNLPDISDINRGNFLELLSFKARDSTWLQEKLSHVVKERASWTSQAIQNEILSILSGFALRRNEAEIKESKYFALIADETSDIARDEQLSVCFSYVINGVKKETFVGFNKMIKTDGESLCNALKDVIIKFGLETENCVGYCFDGAANMSGKNKGVATRLKEDCPHALYVHCYGHRLNLAIQSSLTQVKPLKNSLGVIQSLYNFIEASPKRHAIFCDTDVSGKDGSFVRTLKSQSVTRWACHWEAVKAVYEEIKRIVACLLKLYEDDDPKTSHEAKSLLVAVSDFEFLLGLCTLKVILLNTNSLNKYLQGKDIDVSSAFMSAKATMNVLQKCRSDEDFSLVWQQANVLAEEIKEVLENTDFEFKVAQLPRQKPSRRLQALTGEVLGDGDQVLDVQLYHKINTYFASLDFVVTEMGSRFNDKDQAILTSMGSLILEEKPDDNCFEVVSQHYGLEKDLLLVDFNLLQNFKTRLPCTNSVVHLYEELGSSGVLEMMPELQKVLQIFASIPATSCSSERSFSALRRIKTYLRNRIGQERLSSIAVLNIERSYANIVLKEDLEEVIDTFARRSISRTKFFF